MGYIFGDNSRGFIQNVLDEHVTVITLEGDGSVDVADGDYVNNISFKCNTASYLLDVGTTAGGTEIAEQEEVQQGITKDLHINHTMNGATTFYFTGITAPTVIKIYRR